MALPWDLYCQHPAHCSHMPAPTPGTCRQKKRVTGGEMLVGPSRVLFADEISTGLDR